MKELTQLFSAFKDEFADVPLEQRVVLIEAQLAKRLAFSLALPSAPVNSTITFYTSHCHGLVAEAVSCFNEVYPINVDNTLNLARVLWTARYNLVHNAMDSDLNAMFAVMMHDEGSNLSYNLPPAYQPVIARRAPCQWLFCDFVAKFVNNEPTDTPAN